MSVNASLINLLWIALITNSNSDKCILAPYVVLSNLISSHIFICETHTLYSFICDINKKTTNFDVNFNVLFLPIIILESLFLSFLKLFLRNFVDVFAPQNHFCCANVATIINF